MENLARLTTHIRTELSKVIIGQQEIVDQLLIVLACGGHALLEGVPGLAKTLTVKTLARICGAGIPAHPVHGGLDARRRHWNERLQPRHQRVHAASRTHLHGLAAGRRNQSHDGAHAGRAARSHGRAAGHDRRGSLSSRAELHRVRDAKSGRVRGNVSASRGATGPFSLENQDRLSERGRRSRNSETV